MVRGEERRAGQRYTVSSNSGAESTVEALLVIQAVKELPGVHKRMKNKLAELLPR